MAYISVRRGRRPYAFIPDDGAACGHGNWMAPVFAEWERRIEGDSHSRSDGTHGPGVIESRSGRREKTMIAWTRLALEI